MAYDHQQIGIMMPGASSFRVTASSAGDKFFLQPGYIPFIVRAVTVTADVTATSATLAASTVFSIRKNIAIGVATTTGQEIDRITVPSSFSRGSVIYVKDLNTEIKPNEELVINCVTLANATGQEVRAHALVDYRWETPANLTMTESA